MHNLAAIHEAIARVLPERECIVFRDRRFSWAQTTERTRRLGCVLRAHGLGCFRERRELRGHESGQDAVALYLYNGNEYLEGMLGAFKARCAPINVNYRYVEDELVHLFADSRAAAVVYHAAFAARLERIRSKLGAVKLWLQVDDGSGTPLLPGAIDYEAALASAAPDPPRDLSPDDLYVLYTGGTTGKPKGVLWRQQDIFLGALYPPGAPPDADGVAARALERGDAMRVLPAPPFMHGAAHWAAFNIAFLGGTVVIPSHPERLDAHDIWSTACRERATALTIVGDAFARPLLDALAERSYDLSSLRLLTSGGAILSRERKRELVTAIPGLRINDSLGSSESGMQAVQTTVEGSEVAERATGSFDLARSNVVLSAAMDRVLAPGDDEIGWLAKSGHVPLGYLGDEAKTARTFPTIDGVRYAVPGDRARIDAQGRLQLLGRDAATINSGGEKIFAEEVELALKLHPGIHDALVIGTPHERFGQQVTALVALRAGASRDERAWRDTAAAHLASYKLPRAFIVVPEIGRSPSGKPDYAWARAEALRALEREAPS